MRLDGLVVDGNKCCSSVVVWFMGTEMGWDGMRYGAFIYYFRLILNCYKIFDEGRWISVLSGCCNNRFWVSGDFHKKMNLSIDKPYCLERASFSVYHFLSDAFLGVFRDTVKDTADIGYWHSHSCTPDQVSLSVVINGQVTITRCLEKTHLHFVHSSNCVYAKNKRDQRRISYPRQALMVDPYIIIAWSAIDFIAALFHFAVFFLICTLCLSGGASKKLEIKWRSAKNHPQYNKMQTPCHPSVIELLHIQCQCRKNCNELKGAKAKVVSRHLRFCHIALCAFPPLIITAHWFMD